MPKATFFRLPAARQQEICSTAMSLFTELGYDGVSIRELIRALGISIGSYYKYFESKEEFYLYLCCELSRKSFQYEWQQLPSVFRAPEEFQLHHFLNPEELAFNDSWIYAPEAIKEKFYFGGLAEEIFYPIYEQLARLQEEGKLQEGTDVSFAYYMMISNLFNLLRFFRTHQITDTKEIFRLKRQFLDRCFFRSLLKPEYYEEQTGMPL